MSNLVKNDKKVINAWCMYDWANSVYSLTITTAVFPMYYYAVTGGKDAWVSFFTEMSNTVLYSFTLSAAFLLVSFMNPFLSGIADYGGMKKGFMKFFCYLGALSCCALYFFDESTLWIGVLGFGLAGVGYAGSLVFYNSYLPEIASEDKMDKVSAKGYALGYVGSIILLVINLAMILGNETLGITKGEASKISFLMVGLWWIGFAQITFRKLPANVYEKKERVNLFTKGYSELKKVWNVAKTNPSLKKYLVAFLFFSMGVQTVMYIATIFGEDVVFSDLPQADRTPRLIGLVLILQIIAIPGAYFFSWLSKKKGNIFSLASSLLIWVFVCISAYFMAEGMHVFYYLLGIFVGFVMGGVQSMARSTYAKLIPEDTENHASYFSFYETLEKFSVATGTFVFGFVNAITGTMNASALSLSVFFIVGLVLLLKIPKVKPQDN